MSGREESGGQRRFLGEADELRVIEHSLRAVQFEGHILRGICTSALIAPRRR